MHICSLLHTLNRILSIEEYYHYLYYAHVSPSAYCQSKNITTIHICPLLHTCNRKLLPPSISPSAYFYQHCHRAYLYPSAYLQATNAVRLYATVRRIFDLLSRPPLRRTDLMIPAVAPFFDAFIAQFLSRCVIAAPCLDHLLHQTHAITHRPLSRPIAVLHTTESLLTQRDRPNTGNLKFTGTYLPITNCGACWLIGRVDAYCPKGLGFDRPPL